MLITVLTLATLAILPLSAVLYITGWAKVSTVHLLNSSAALRLAAFEAFQGRALLASIAVVACLWFAHRWRRCGGRVITWHTLRHNPKNLIHVKPRKKSVRRKNR